MSGHTPGPWMADAVFIPDGPRAADCHIRSPERHWSICVAHRMTGCTDPTRDVGEEEAAANARLIAAAPDLLEALRAVISVADRKTVEFDKAHAAIAKATGVAQ